MTRTGILLMLAFVLLQGCASKTVTRVDPDTVTDLTGRWNDEDSRQVATEMIRDVMARPWLSRFVDANNREPVIILGLIQNKSHEHIDSELFVRNMEREFVNSGEIRVVQRDEFRNRMREERADQEEFASPETQKRWGRELGADYMVNGYIGSTVEEHRRRTLFGKRSEKVVFYQVNLELSHLETNEKVWIGEKQIKKLISN